jgi:hypothetical protein
MACTTPAASRITAAKNHILSWLFTFRSVFAIAVIQCNLTDASDAFQIVICQQCTTIVLTMRNSPLLGFLKRPRSAAIPIPTRESSINVVVHLILRLVQSEFSGQLSCTMSSGRRRLLYLGHSLKEAKWRRRRRRRRRRRWRWRWKLN